MLQFDDGLPYRRQSPGVRISKWLEYKSSRGKETIVIDQSNLIELLGQAGGSEGQDLPVTVGVKVMALAAC